MVENIHLPMQKQICHHTPIHLLGLRLLKEIGEDSMVIKHGNMLTDGFDYYITDELGGVHTDGVGYAPDGTFCGECTRQSCTGCPAWEKEN